MNKVRLEDIKIAQTVLKSVIKETSLLECKELSKMTGGNVFLKNRKFTIDRII